MPTSTLAQECSSQEVNLQAGQMKKSSLQEKNFKKLQVSVKQTNEQDTSCMSPVDSAHVLLKPAEPQFDHFDYDQKHYNQPNGQMNEYAATFVPSQGGNRMDSYVDLSQCEKENKRNFQYRQQQMTNGGHPSVQTVSGHQQYQTQSHAQNHCPINIENCVASQNHGCPNLCPKTRKSSNFTCLTCFIVAMVFLQLVWMGLFAWLLVGKTDFRHSDLKDDGHTLPHKDQTGGYGSHDSHQVTMSPVKIPEPPQYPSYAPPITTRPLPVVPNLGIKMEIDPTFLSSAGNTVMWTYPGERHLTGIEYHNGYFRVNVTGFYFIQSTLSLDHRPNNDEDGNSHIRLNHCIKVDGRPKMDVCENIELTPIKAGASTVQDPMMYLESGSSVHVSISHMTKIYDSVSENRFVMFLQRTV
ncbi:uncharacterized protein LOC117320148 [Pecten maximus]|uniref:uncharacterized protein LOC117320148 n=1 Tax=Pecten maximus TaxID=6579 RepID=UPI0014588136|nr:uncharacterized protein LOC117320148 [Pecten maximus]